MNPRWELFRAGTPFYAGHVILKGGRRVPVFDKARKARRAAQVMSAAGIEEAVIADRLHRPLPFVRAAARPVFSRLVRLGA